MKDIERLARVMRDLTRGWRENVETYGAVTVNVRHDPLLAQLGYAALIKGTGEPSLGSNPNKSASRPPGNAAPLNLLDRIAEEAREAHREALELTGVEHPSVVPTLHVCGVLHDLMACAIALQHQHPRAVARMARLGESWVRACRLLLGYEKRTVMLRDVVCDQCAGALIVPVDASGDVVCVGVPSDDPEVCEAPCGRVYPQWSWPDLLAQRESDRANLWTTRDAVAYLVSERPVMSRASATRWLYNQAQEDKIKNYGNSRKALWNSQEVLDQLSHSVGA